MCASCIIHTHTLYWGPLRQYRARWCICYVELCVTTSPSHHDQAIPILSPLLFMHVGHPYIPLFKIRIIFDLLVIHVCAPISPKVAADSNTNSVLPWFHGTVQGTTCSQLNTMLQDQIKIHVICSLVTRCTSRPRHDGNHNLQSHIHS